MNKGNLRQHPSDGWKRTIPIDTAANATYTKVIGSIPTGSQGQVVQAVRLTCETTENADPTNNAVLTLERSDGSVFATFSLATTSFVANTPATLTLTPTTIAGLTVAGGQHLLLRKGAIGGTGILIGELLVEVDFQPIR